MYVITYNNSVSLFPLRITGDKSPSGRVFMLSIYLKKTIVYVLVSGALLSLLPGIPTYYRNRPA